VQPGFEPRGVLTFWQTLPKSRYGERTQQIQFFDKLRLRLASLPGVQDVGMVSPLPFSDNSQSTTFSIVGQSAAAPGMEPGASHLTIDGNYFHAMRIPLVRGRTFNERDQANSPPVIMVNEAFAKAHLGKGTPLGQRVVVGSSKTSREIVGVVGNAKHNSLAEPAGPEFYIPFTQDPDRYMDIVVRTGEPTPNDIENAIRRAVHEIDAQQFVPVITPLSKLLGRTLAQARFNTLLLGAFATVAILLAAIGIYGVIAYTVTQRTKEIGIRMALGAQQRQMLTMILRQSLAMATIGIAVGILCAFGATRLLSSLLFGVGTTDLITYGAVILLLTGAAVLAALVPARRATKINPVIALHYE
jgi:putative ABC transport system permease protein